MAINLTFAHHERCSQILMEGNWGFFITPSFRYIPLHFFSVQLFVLALEYALLWGL